MALWAIECNNPEYGSGDNLLGWGWFQVCQIPISKRGDMGPALFPSRILARRELPYVKSSFPKAKVVKVKVIVVKA